MVSVTIVPAARFADCEHHLVTFGCESHYSWVSLVQTKETAGDRSESAKWIYDSIIERCCCWSNGVREKPQNRVAALFVWSESDGWRLDVSQCPLVVMTTRRTRHCDTTTVFRSFVAGTATWCRTRWPGSSSAVCARWAAYWSSRCPFRSSCPTSAASTTRVSAPISARHSRPVYNNGQCD